MYYSDSFCFHRDASHQLALFAFPSGNFLQQPTARSMQIWWYFKNSINTNKSHWTFIKVIRVSITSPTFTAKWWKTLLIYLFPSLRLPTYSFISCSSTVVFPSYEYLALSSEYLRESPLSKILLYDVLYYNLRNQQLVLPSSGRPKCAGDEVEDNEWKYVQRPAWNKY